MFIKQIVLATTIAILAAPATASKPASEAGPGTVYCIKYQPETGSRIGRQECMTRKQWAEKGVNIDEFIKK